MSVIDLDDPGQLVKFGTGGHRGSRQHGTFTESHILAVTPHAASFKDEAHLEAILHEPEEMVNRALES